MIVLSCGIKISAVRHLVLSQSTHVTDGRRTDGRTDGQNYDSQDRPRICSRGKYTKHKIMNHHTNRLALVKHKTQANQILQRFTCKNCLYQCACIMIDDIDCARLCYTVEHRTVWVMFRLIFIIAQMFYVEWRGGLARSD